jgi:hypothetical protein
LFGDQCCVAIELQACRDGLQRHHACDAISVVTEFMVDIVDIVGLKPACV